MPKPKLDFSQFHDLMHPPFSRYCFSQYGGPRQHFKVWYDHKFEYKPAQIWHRYVLCKLLKRHVVRGGEEIVFRWPSRIGRWCVWCHETEFGERDVARAYKRYPKYCLCGHDDQLHREVDEEATATFRAKNPKLDHKIWVRDFHCRHLDCACEDFDYDRERTHAQHGFKDLINVTDNIL